MTNIKVKFKEAYQDFGAYALLKNVTDKGVLIVDGTEVLNSIVDLPTTDTVDGQEKAVIVQNGQVVTTSINNIAGSGGSGGGNNTTSGLFPNGIELVTESRDFLPSDVGKILGVQNNDIILSFPAVSPFENGDTIGVYIFADNSGFETSPGRLIFPFWNNGDFAELSTLVYGAGEFVLLGLQQVYDNDINKTGLRYIMEKLVDVRPYKSITLAISQTNTDDPVIEHVLENGVNETFTITRSSVGSYFLDITNPLFLEYKTICFVQSQVYFLSPFIVTAARNTDTQIFIQTLLMDGTPTDSLIPLEFVFEIRIYK